jgi:valyl-tRNA synthetase
VDPQAEAALELVMSAISAVRNIRAEVGLAPGKEVPVVLACHDETARAVLLAQEGRLRALARVSDVSEVVEGQAPDKSASAALAGVTLYVPLAGLVDFAAEAARLAKEIAKLDKESASSRNKLANQGFLAKAPAEVVEKEKAKVEEADSKMARLAESLTRVKSFL